MEGQYWNKNNSCDTEIFCTGRLSAQGDFLVLVLWSPVLVLTLHLLCTSHDFPEEVVVALVRVLFSIHRPDN